MAAGDVFWFNQGLVDLGNKIHNLSSDALRFGLVTNTTPPAKNTAGPHWGGTGTTNFLTTQVSIGGTSYTGPITVTVDSWAFSGSNLILSLTSTIVLAQDASGFTDARWGILYNNTDANKRAIGYLDLGTARSLVTGSLTIDWNGAGDDILQITN